MRAETVHTAEIVSIGTELLLGTITDTNASYLADRLASLGVNCHFISQVGDNLARIGEVLGRAVGRSDLVITTGGLGPTQDDLTREAIAELLDEEMRVDPKLEAHLVSLFARRGWRMPESNRKQSTLIPSAEAISNPVGTAPGWWVCPPDTASDKRGRLGEIVSMPGVPFEMKRMWEREVEPKLRARSEFVIASRTLKVLGMGESRVEEVVKDIMCGSNPTLAPYAKSDGIHLRITARATGHAEAERLIAPLEAEVRARLDGSIYGTDYETPQGVVSVLLQKSGLRFAVIEVGDGANGSLSNTLGAHPLCAGVIGGRTVEVIAKILGLRVHEDLSDVSALLEGVSRKLGAELAIMVSVQQEAQGDHGAVVQFSAQFSTLLSSPGQEIKESSQSWRTAGTEVGRLVGLAALNHLRTVALRASPTDESSLKV